jgi:hypothetical protein
MIFFNPRLWIALLLVVLIDLAFQLGAYRTLASRDSHAGLTLRTMSALNLRGRAQVDAVTLGSSVAVYGIDHGRIEKIAAAAGFEHANLSLPGSALMTFRQWGKWLPVNAPRVKRGVLVFSPGDFQAIGNGSYELGIVAPMKRLGDGLWWREHVPFSAADVDTYGLFSGLMLYRHDLKQLFAHPLQRRTELRWWRNYLRSQDYLASPVALEGDVCGLDLSSPAACAASAKPAAMTATAFAALQQTCVQISQRARAGATPTPGAVRAQVLGRQMLAELNWDRAVVAVLPMHPIWDSATADVGNAPTAVDTIKLTFQQPIEQGRVRYVNLQNVLTLNATTPACTLFADLYHVNARGRAVLTDALERELAWVYPQQ